MNRQIKILVVDDEPKICHLIEELLKQDGFMVDVCYSSINALETVKKCVYQMLITDLKMPGIDGLELIRKAKEFNPGIRAIMVTGYTTVDAAVQSLRHGVDDFITKPFNIFELKKTVKRILITNNDSLVNKQHSKELKTTSPDLNIHKQDLTENVDTINQQLTDANDKLVQSIKELDIIQEISKAVTSALDVDELLRLCLEVINRKLNIKHSSIMLIDERRNELSVRASQGYRSLLVLGKTQEKNEGIAGRVVKDKKPILVRDIRREDRFKANERSDYRTKSFISVPLILRGGVIGVVNVIDKIADGDFCESDVNLLCAVADQIAAMIENARRYKELEENCFNMVKRLADCLEAKNCYTSGHSQRVSEYSSVIANIMGLSGKEKNILFYSALLHDIGKISIPESVFNKSDKLDNAEYSVIRLHPVRGEEILKPLGFLENTICHIRGHHENYDGSGYPDGLGGKDLHPLTKIITVADAFDAMTSERAYRPSMKTDEAILELKRMSGKQFDPEVVDTFASSEIIKMKTDFEDFSSTNR